MSKEIHSDCECDQDPVPISDGPLPHIEAQLERLSASFEWLASVDLESLFANSARLMKAVPWFMKEAHRSAMRIALGKIDEGRSHHAILRASHGCKLFLLLPRLLSTDLPEGARFRNLSCNVGWKHSRVESGHLFWPANEESSARGVQAFTGRQRRPVRDDVESRAARAEALVHMGELSAARQVLEGAPLAPGTNATLAMLPLRRPS